MLERTLSEASQPLLGRRSSSAFCADGEAVIVSVSANGHAQAEEQPYLFCIWDFVYCEVLLMH